MTIEPHVNPFNPDGTVYRDPAKVVSQLDVLLNGRYAPPGCANYHCDGAAGYLDSPFCPDCIWKLWAYIDVTQSEASKVLAREGQFEALHRREAKVAEMDRRAEERIRNRRASKTTPGTIYYLRVGDLIKIGFTTDIDQRMSQYPPNVALLATHPGTMETERQMHHKFLHRLAKGREWFTPCDEIEIHIDSVLAQFGEVAA